MTDLESRVAALERAVDRLANPMLSGPTYSGLVPGPVTFVESPNAKLRAAVRDFLDNPNLGLIRERERAIQELRKVYEETL